MKHHCTRNLIFVFSTHVSLHANVFTPDTVFPRYTTSTDILRKDKNCVDKSKHLTPATKTRTRGSHVEHTDNAVSKYHIFLELSENGIVSPSDVVTSESLQIFKLKLSSYLQVQLVRYHWCFFIYLCFITITIIIIIIIIYLFVLLLLYLHIFMCSFLLHSIF